MSQFNNDSTHCHHRSFLPRRPSGRDFGLRHHAARRAASRSLCGLPRPRLIRATVPLPPGPPVARGPSSAGTRPRVGARKWAARVAERRQPAERASAHAHSHAPPGASSGRRLFERHRHKPQACGVPATLGQDTSMSHCRRADCVRGCGNKIGAHLRLRESTVPVSHYPGAAGATFAIAMTRARKNAAIPERTSDWWQIVAHAEVAACQRGEFGNEQRRSSQPLGCQMVVTGPRLREDLALEVIRHRPSCQAMAATTATGGSRLRSAFACRISMTTACNDRRTSTGNGHSDSSERWRKAWERSRPRTCTTTGSARL